MSGLTKDGRKRWKWKINRKRKRWSYGARRRQREAMKKVWATKWQYRRKNAPETKLEGNKSIKDRTMICPNCLKRVNYIIVDNTLYIMG